MVWVRAALLCTCSHSVAARGQAFSYHLARLTRHRIAKSLRHTGLRSHGYGARPRRAHGCGFLWRRCIQLASSTAALSIGYGLADDSSKLVIANAECRNDYYSCALRRVAMDEREK